MLDLADRLATGVHAALDRRLAPNSPEPVALALSGGGDSRALALIAAEWARERGRVLAILTVDHRLNPRSGDWTAECAEFAARLGSPFRALAWDGAKPAHGLPAAARAARHRLLADAARAMGAKVILLGHTAGDLREAAAMRAAGSTTPSPREWSPSPLWPEGRGLFLLRPMLLLERQEIRDWLTARGETWIDDPSNEDLRFARARARAAGDLDPAPPADEGVAPDLELIACARAAVVDAAGVVTASRRALTPRFVAIAALCAAGASRPPRSERLTRIVARLAEAAPFVSTLAGARIEADRDVVRFMREPGELARGGLAPLVLTPGQTVVWDGRFEIASAHRATIVALAGHARRLANTEALAAIAPKARGALPFVVEAGGCPALAQLEGIWAHSLVRNRLLAACGAITAEADIPT